MGLVLFIGVLELSRATFLINFSSDNVPKFTSTPYEIGGSKKVNPKTKNIRISKNPINEVIIADFFS